MQLINGYGSELFQKLAYRRYILLNIKKCEKFLAFVNSF